jgi:hypothetical protein
MQQKPTLDVTTCMTYASSIDREEEGRFVVRRPRVTDAIGNLLTGVFPNHQRLPDDIAELLCRLDSVTRQPTPHLGSAKP